jgi:hypothetical protein
MNSSVWLGEPAVVATIVEIPVWEEMGAPERRTGTKTPGHPGRAEPSWLLRLMWSSNMQLVR